MIVYSFVVIPRTCTKYSIPPTLPPIIFSVRVTAIYYNILYWVSSLFIGIRGNKGEEITNLKQSDPKSDALSS